MRVLGWVISLISLAAAGVMGRPGQVATRDGRSHPGFIRLDTNRVVVANTKARRVDAIPWTEVQRVMFEVPETSEAESDGRVPTSSREWMRPVRGLPEGWLAADLGYGQVFNEDVTYAGTYRMRVTPLGSASAEHQWHFVYRPVRGFAQLTARVVEIFPRRGGAMAGLMIRDSLSPAARFAFVGFTAGQGGVVLYRGVEGTRPLLRRFPYWRRPCWIRLTRYPDRIEFAHSPLGQRWETVQVADVPFPDEISIGWAAHAGPPIPSSVRSAAGAIEFSLDQVELETTRSVGRAVHRLVLASGSVARGYVFQGDASRVRYRDYLGPAEISTRALAHIQFQWVPSASRRHLTEGRPGVILRNGEWVEGTFHGVEEGQLLLSSVPFGLRRFNLNNQVAAVVFRKPEAQRPRVEVRMLDGSLWQGVEASIGPNEILLTDTTAGVLHLPVYQLREVRRTD